MKICKKCNAPNSNDAKMCNQCGEPLPTQIYPDTQNQTQQPQIVIQQPKKTHGCLIAFVIVLVVVIALITLICIISVSVASNKDDSKSTISNSSTSNSSISENEVSENEQENKEPKEVIYNVGDTATLNNWEITVSDFQIVDRIDSKYDTIYYEPDESGNKFAQAFVTVSNIGKENDKFLPSFSMGDDVHAKLLFEDYEFSSTVLISTTDIHDSTITPMSSQDGFIAFSIPSTVYNSEGTIRLVFNNGFDSVSFQLR